MLKNKIIVLAVIFLGISGLTYADSITPELRAAVGNKMKKPHIGFRVGAAEPEGELNAGGQFALEYGLQPYVPFSMALEAGYAAYDEAGFDFNRTSFLLKTSYNFGGNIPIIKYSYIGLGVGAAWEDDSVNDGLAALAVPQAGFDVPLNDLFSQPLSLGLNTSYTFSTRGTPDVFAVSGVVKYWF